MKLFIPAIAIAASLFTAPVMAEAQKEPMPDANWLFVQMADSATVQGNKLVLTGVAPQTLMFTDRPERMTGDTPTAGFVKTWATGTDSFKKDPPNATLSVVVNGKSAVSVVELTNPELSGNTLTYTIRVLSDEKPVSGTTPSLFIDWWRAGFGHCWRGVFGHLHCN